MAILGKAKEDPLLSRTGRSGAVFLICFLLVGAAGESVPEIRRGFSAPSLRQSREKARIVNLRTHRSRLGGILGSPPHSPRRYPSRPEAPRDLIHVSFHSHGGGARTASISDSQTISAQNVLVTLYLNFYPGLSSLSTQTGRLSCEKSLTVSLEQFELNSLCWRSHIATLDGLTNNLCEWRRLADPMDLVEQLLGRAKACTSLGHLEEAWSGLALASHLAEGAGALIQTEKLRLLYSESIQEVYDEMIAFQWEQKHDGESALAIAERARAFPRSGPLRTSWNAPDDGVAVAYALLPDRLLIWLIDDSGVSTFERKVSSRQVEDLISRFLSEIRRSGPELRSISGELHELLLPKPVTQIARDKVLYFIPDRGLNRIPFAALLNPRTGHFLVQDHPVALARSVSGLRELRPVSQAHPSVYVVNPDFDRKSFPECAALEGAQAETAFVSSTFPYCRTMTGNLPTSGQVLAEIDRVDTFIFVGHSVTNSNLPSRSCLLVAPSVELQDAGVLAGEEIANHKFAHLNLVILSGCATVGPTTARCRSLAGVAGRFLDAGAHTVVGTLWSLNDAKSLSILAPFYRELASGRPAVWALQDSQIAALEKAPEKVSDWADFVAVFN